MKKKWKLMSIQYSNKDLFFLLTYLHVHKKVKILNHLVTMPIRWDKCQGVVTVGDGGAYTSILRTLYPMGIYFLGMTYP